MKFAEHIRSEVIEDTARRHTEELITDDVVAQMLSQDHCRREFRASGWAARIHQYQSLSIP